MRGTKWAAMAVTAMVFTTAGCGAADGAPGEAKPPSSPRPAGTGPLTKSVVRADLDSSVTDAGVPANAPEYAQADDDAPAGSPLSCGVTFKGFGTDTAALDLTRFEALLNELRERAWEQPAQRSERKDRDGVVGVAEVELTQRGWSMRVEYRNLPEEGVITVLAYDLACLKKHNRTLAPLN
ncbi:hypothetical protein [Streptomyces sp. NPDC055055]